MDDCNSSKIYPGNDFVNHAGLSRTAAITLMHRPSPRERKALKGLITRSLRKQGFQVRKNHILPPEDLNKEKFRELHRIAVGHRLAEAEPRLCRYEGSLLGQIASGDEVVPEKVTPRLVEVQPDSDGELLFRYCSLHWSIPVSSGYGRRLRFLVVDDQNEKLIGLFGLCDPVFSVAARDTWIGWDFESRKRGLKHVMEAFILGAVPPYSHLLCGKLVAMLCASDEVRTAFHRKYGEGESVIRGTAADGRLALITTTSALGRSSIYNRLRLGKRLVMQSVGYTSGWGEFQFTNGAYSRLHAYVSKYCEATAKQKSWGTGFRNRREVVRKCLSNLGLSDHLLHHGIKRELFVAPLAKNTREFLQGNRERLHWCHQSAEDLFQAFRARWLLPRAKRDPSYAEFDRETYRLWQSRR